MDPRPPLPHQSTSVTFGEPELSETKGSSPGRPSNVPDTSEYDDKGEEPAPRPAPKPTWESSPIDRRIYDILLLTGVIVMLSWPLVFWGVVFHMKGIQMNDRLARVVTDYPHSTSFFVTLIGSLVCLVIDILFSLSVIRFAQEWVTVTDGVTVFHVSLLSAFRHQTWPWGLKDLKTVLARNRLLPVLLAGVCIGAFTFVPSSTTSLLGPAPFNKTAALTGTELDFSSTASDCVQFLNANPLSNNCDWQVYKNVSYTSCLGQNQLVDVLESGRGNILSLLSNNSQSLTFSQFGNKDGLHFLGPLRGILPMGPNGVPAFDTLHASPLSDPQARAAMLSYNYTLDHQGLSSNVSCIYDTQSPIRFEGIDEQNLTLQYNGTCMGQADVLNGYNVKTFASVNADNGLMYWACKSLPDSQQEQSYYVYLRGRTNYTDSIGNITCTVSPIKPAIFSATYHSLPGIFSLKEPVSVAPAIYPPLIERALVALGSAVWESQNWEANLVAESVFTFAVKSFGLQPYERTPQHLHLYSAMIQGILEYEAAYIRLIYSTVDNPPASCIRTVEGTATYEVIGWSAEITQIGFLMPMALINLASLIIITAVLVMAKGKARDFDPTEARPLLAANAPDGQRPEAWDDQVFYFSRRESVTNAYNRFSEGLSLGDAAKEVVGGLIPSP